jgi:hypothetical protein
MAGADAGRGRLGSLLRALPQQTNADTPEPATGECGVNAAAGSNEGKGVPAEETREANAEDVLLSCAGRAVRYEGIASIADSSRLSSLIYIFFSIAATAVVR